MKLLGLTGKARCGKTTVNDLLFDKYYVDSYGFADPLKEATMQLLDVDYEMVNGLDGYDREEVLEPWGFSIRQFLQILGTDCIRVQFGADFWLMRMQIELDRRQERIERDGLEDRGVVITDVRFENEAQFVREQGGRILHISRPNAERLSEGVEKHATEKGIAFNPADILLVNDKTIDDLSLAVESVWKLL